MGFGGVYLVLILYVTGPCMRTTRVSWRLSRAYVAVVVLRGHQNRPGGYQDRYFIADPGCVGAI